MSGPTTTSVYEIGVTSMRLSHRAAEAVGLLWPENQVHVVWHQTVAPYLDTGFARLLHQKITIDLLVAVLEEKGLTTVPTLRHVVGKAGDHHTGQWRHAA